MKTATVIAREGMEHHRGWGGAFADGLRRHGWRVQVDSVARQCDMVVCFGARHAKLYQRQSGAGEVCVMERGYLGNRFEWASVSFGGALNGRAIFRAPFHDGRRWEQHFAGLMKPWREKPGGYALILHQLPGDVATQNVSLPQFYERARHAYRALEMDVRERPHPHLLPRHGPERMAEVQSFLAADLDGAAVAVAWNSNSTVDAVLAGVPTVAMDRGSMAWEVTGRELGVIPAMPDRTAWAHALAWKQYTRDEIASGYCWEMVGEIASGYCWEMVGAP